MPLVSSQSDKKQKSYRGCCFEDVYRILPMSTEFCRLPWNIVHLFFCISVSLRSNLIKLTSYESLFNNKHNYTRIWVNLATPVPHSGHVTKHQSQIWDMFAGTGGERRNGRGGFLKTFFYFKKKFKVFFPYAK